MCRRFIVYDYKEYFSAIQEKEKGMVEFLDKIIPLFEDKHILEILKDIREEEKIHCKSANDLKVMLGSR